MSTTALSPKHILHGQDRTTAVPPKCALCKREIKDWEWFSYYHDGMTTTTCMACIKEYEKVLGGKQ